VSRGALKTRTKERFEKDSLFAHVKVLAQEIGPRGTGTVGEEEAAHYVRDRLQHQACR
jgi:hypothetical protein